MSYRLDKQNRVRNKFNFQRRDWMRELEHIDGADEKPSEPEQWRYDYRAWTLAWARSRQARREKMLLELDEY